MLISAVIIFLAFIVNAFAGFGGGIVAVPLLVLLYPLTTISPFVNLLGFSSNALLIKTFYKNIQYWVLIPLILGNLVGGIIGVHFLVLDSNIVLVKILGIVIPVSSVIIFFVDKKISILPNILLGFITGILSGILSAIFAVGGAPIILYLSSVFKDKNLFRSTSLIFFLFNGVIQIPLFAIHGLITRQVLFLFVICFPVLILSNWLGHKLHIKSSEEIFRKVVFIILILSGILLILK
ncbi:MAG TPA: sulfite exporter TauE/SafE family protein [Patescibacteria group bacterium]|nr:sulfite exporter TauE/SafE family protein [Patescibacteria group bacterium]